MAKPHIHARSSVKIWGGKEEDYMDIHTFMDASKSSVADNRHRFLTHNAWFISFVIPRVFGETFTNSDGRTVSTRDVAERHCLEDFGGFIPTAQDYAMAMKLEPWMNNGREKPPSFVSIQSKEKIEVYGKD